MELRNDDLQSVALVSDSLADSLEQSRVKTERIEQLLREIARCTNVDLDAVNLQGDNNDDDDDDDEHTREIQRLKAENLQLLLDIERQEFLKKQWDKVISKNQKLLDSLVEWAKDDPKSVEYQMDELQREALRHIEELQRSTRMLQEDVVESEGFILDLLTLLAELEELINKDFTKLSTMKQHRQRALEKALQLQEAYVKNL